jgi:beta-glucosidase
VWKLKNNNYELEHLQIVANNAGECCLFLKRNADFPLKEVVKIAAFGSGVRHTIKGGTGSGDVNSRFVVTIEQALREAGFEIVTESWLDGYDEAKKQRRKEFIRELKERAKKKRTLAMLEALGAVMTPPSYQGNLESDAGVAIYVLARDSGEGNDREPVSGDILLTEQEISDILYLNKRYDKFMLVLNVGGPVDLSPVLEVDNILLLSQLGANTGRVFAEILLGIQNPSGKLTTTWSKWEDYCVPSFGDKDDTYYEESIYVGYRYFDSVKKKALFPFGYGLSYSDFEHEFVGISVEGNVITLKANVKNRSDFEGKDVLQLYLSKPQGKLNQPYQDLVAFRKSRKLKKGETELLALTFDLTQFASFDEDSSSYVLEKGDYILRLGNSSVDTKAVGIVTLPEDFVVRKVKRAFTECDVKEMKIEVDYQDDLSGLEKIIIDEIKTETVSYELVAERDGFVSSLSDEELAYLANGSFGGSVFSVIGQASKTVAGAAGETTRKIKGLDTLVMADGPAGLRLSPQYYVDKKGAHPVGINNIMVSLVDFAPKLLKPIIKKQAYNKAPKGHEIKEQYTTALPIGTALAQSFNLEYVEACGSVVGREMGMFNVDLWLAPALNIHRSIRCGRNFEYFSEDPLVSGLIASAITKGVQKNKNKGVTLKHFCCNNQETNRYNNNAHVSERVIREIYLRGFEIAVKQANPMAVMTSYNLLNGEHTSESFALIHDILRCEWGFKGIVMTDWIVMGGTFDKTSIHRGPITSLIVKAGGDLVMPGSKRDFKEILRALKQGELSRKVLEENATRVLRLIRRIKG